MLTNAKLVISIEIDSKTDTYQRTDLVKEKIEVVLGDADAKTIRAAFTDRLNDVRTRVLERLAAVQANEATPTSDN